MAWRHFTLVGFFLVISLGLMVRVVFLNVTEGQFLIDQGERRSIKSQEIAAHRGVIYDRYGEPLAVSTPVAAIYTNPKAGELNDEDRQLLCSVLSLDCERLSRSLARQAGQSFAYIQRGVAWEEVERLKALELPGVHFIKEYRRFYPAGETAAHVVGITDIDDRGIEGIEKSFDESLKGEPGRRVVLKDRRGNVIKDLASGSAARFGSDLTLSIDLRLQFLAYRELKAAVQSHRAESGSMVMLDVATGEILAMANQPSYNPNGTLESTRGMRNRAVTDLYEPGSTMKPLAVLAALESGQFERDTLIDTAPGYYRVGRDVVRGRNRGQISVETVLKKSSQVGIAKMAMALPERAVFELMARAGVGEYLGTGLPGEVAGKLTDQGLQRPIVRTTLAFGYGLAITPLQLAEAYMTLAGGGVRRPVSILRREAHSPGERVYDAELVAELISMMEGVTDSDGTAPGARIEGYRVAGKTGTIRKVGPSGYDDGRHGAWFAGIVPASRPRIVTVVLIDEPKGEEYEGGAVAGPVFGRVMTRAVHLLGVPPDDLQLAELNP
jgi:cell division protein FtsI (penicillin-binding protein 3)